MSESADDFDARFAEIVAHFQVTDGEPLQRAETVDPAPPAPAVEPPAGVGPPVVEPSVAEPPVAPIPTQWRMPTEPAPSVLDEQAGFVPPDPRLPEGDPAFYAIIAGLVGGPLWVLYLYFFDRYTRPLWWWLAGGTFFVAIVALFLRQPATREDDDDDGAVV